MAEFSRRDLLRGRLGRPAPPPLHRPPRAVDEATFLDDCTRCEACIAACPAYAITHAPHDAGPARGTPVIAPFVAPCVMCADEPCVTACTHDGTGVLDPLLPVRMGEAVIARRDCHAWNDRTCDACVATCPVEGALVAIDGRPHVEESVCTGCGMCAFECPTDAIRIIPTPERPPRPSDGAGG